MRSSLIKYLKAFTVLLLSGGLLAFFGFAAASGARAATSSFVQRSGQELTLDGTPWRFVADNDYQLTSLPGGYDCGRALSQDSVDSIMRDVKNSGASVIRTWFFQGYYDLGANGQRVSPSWEAFDRVLQAAADNGLKVIPVLVNEYQDCEPQSVTKNLGFFQSGYKQAGYGYPLSFKAYASTVARHYADDSTIAFWQIGNELYDDTPSGCSSDAESQGAHALRSFADDMTETIKSVDPNHLVSLGTQGSGQCGLQGDDYQYVMNGAVDLCEYHDYNAVTQAMPSDGSNLLAQRIQQCQAINKPLFIGESGIPANVDQNGQSSGPVTDASLQRRASFFAAKMTAAFNAGVVGYGLWDKEQDASDSGWNANSDGYFGIGPDDPSNSVTSAAAEALSSVAGTASGLASSARHHGASRSHSSRGLRSRAKGVHKVTAPIPVKTPAPVATPAPVKAAAAVASVLTSFEDGGADGWAPAAGYTSLSVANSTAEAIDGTHSLAVTLDQGAGQQKISSPNIGATVPGATITMHVYLPAGAPSGVQVTPYVESPNQAQTNGTVTTLTPGWNTLTLAIPANLQTGISSLGLQVDDGPGWAGSLYLDNIGLTVPGGAHAASVHTSRHHTTRHGRRARR